MSMFVISNGYPHFHSKFHLFMSFFFLVKNSKSKLLDQKERKKKSLEFLMLMAWAVFGS